MAKPKCSGAPKKQRVWSPAREQFVLRKVWFAYVRVTSNADARARFNRRPSASAESDTPRAFPDTRIWWRKALDSYID